MKKDSIDQLFENLEGQFDTHEPIVGHKGRFLERLQEDAPDNKKNRSFWGPLLAAAASVVICIALFTTFNTSDAELSDLASVSPELSETQDFFNITIENELKKLEQERSPETEEIIYHAMRQLKVLEDQYDLLKEDLKESDGDQRVIYAMISNFQNRIDVLNTVLEQIENYKQLKQNTDETTTTI